MPYVVCEYTRLYFLAAQIYMNETFVVIRFKFPISFLSSNIAFRYCKLSVFSFVFISLLTVLSWVINGLQISSVHCPFQMSFQDWFYCVKFLNYFKFM